MKLYALIDGANVPDLHAILKKYDPPASCLYNDPIQPNLIAVAPYIVQLTDPIIDWLATYDAPWGLYLASKAPFIEVRKHLRKYTYVIIPEVTNPIHFRFYDPRSFWELMDVLDDWSLHAFLGPIDTVVTFYNGVFRQEDFKARRNQFPKLLSMRSSYLSLNEAQYSIINEINEKRYIELLNRHMHRYVDPTLIEKTQNNADKIHKQMLEHERDIKGSAITNPVDQAFLLDQTVKAQERAGIHLEELINESIKSSLKLDPTYFQQAYYHYSRQTEEWRLVRGNHQEKVPFVISRELSKIGKTPMSQNDFHSMTNGEYAFLERVEWEKEQEQKKAAILNQLKDINAQPYFLKQLDQWYYVDLEDYAHLVEDARVQDLNKLYQYERITKILEGYFHGRTNDRHKIKAVPVVKSVQAPLVTDTAYLPETIDELNSAIDQLAYDLYYFCQAKAIETDRAIKGLGHLLMYKNIFRLKEMPPDWLATLQNADDPGFLRVEQLQLAHLGVIPAYRKLKDSL